MNIWGFRLVLFGLGSLSVGSLLLYFFGVASFVALSAIMLTVEIAGLIGLAWFAWSRQWGEAQRLLLGGLWAGAMATLVYDLVRVPLVYSGIPVFKAISYFGTVLLGIEQPSTASELLGWSYHFSNGISFALMYAAIAVRPGPVSAVAWGLSLEGAMLLTPYAEVFGYQRDARFMAITIGSHACYGLALWLALRHSSARPLSRATVGAGVATAGLGLFLMAADFHRLEAASLPPSPPASLGPELHVTWDVPEPDRVAALWVMKRFANTQAQFHFIPPFHPLTYGVPFDVPEAEIRRAGNLSATEVLLDRIPNGNDPPLAALRRMAYLSEVTPWMMPSDPEADELAARLRAAADAHCGTRLKTSCLDRVFAVLDEWYKGAR
jgi:hypothetical protein